MDACDTQFRYKATDWKLGIRGGERGGSHAQRKQRTAMSVGAFMNAEPQKKNT